MSTVATYFNPTGSTVTLQDLNNLQIPPGGTLPIPDEIGLRSWDLAEALQQLSLVIVNGGAWRFEDGRKTTEITAIPSMTASAASSGVGSPFFTSVYNEGRIYCAVQSGDVTLTYQSSPDGGLTWFTSAEFNPITLTAGMPPTSYPLTSLGALGQLAWASTSGAVFAARVVLKT